MKKTLLSIGLLSAMAFSANAQDAAVAATASGFKPAAGNITFELNAQSPFSAAGGSPFSLNNGLRFRYFLSEGTALRVNFSIAKDGFNKTYNNTTTSSTTPPAPGVATNTTTVSDKFVVKSSMFEFSIAPGVEFHKGVSERLSVYYGAYLDFTLNSKKGSIEATPGSMTDATGTSSAWTGSAKQEVKGGWYGASSPATVTFDPLTQTYTGANVNANAGFTRIGLFGVIGADYYITKALYLGVEAGWGFSNTKQKAIETTTSGSIGGGKAAGAAEPEKTSFSDKNDGKEGGKKFVITPTVNAAFRFGFWF